MSLGAYPFVVPNAQTSGVNPAPLSNFQAQYDALDMVIMAAGSLATGVVYDGSGNYGAVRPQITPNMTIKVDASTDSIMGVQYTCAAASTLTIAGNVTGNPRFDLVVSDSGGANYVVAGTAAAVPDFPGLTLDGNGNLTQVVKAAIYVPNGVVSISSANIISHRIMIYPQTAAQYAQRSLLQ